MAAERWAAHQRVVPRGKNRTDEKVLQGWSLASAKTKRVRNQLLLESDRTNGSGKYR
jgi:hypothetical protein